MHLLESFQILHTHFPDFEDYKEYDVPIIKRLVQYSYFNEIYYYTIVLKRKIV